ncbi:MAG TPA: CHAT domain-containing protein [Gemmatimonadaceae bacterium]|nr:CHAT domain-containing protein [Gemmatimonadaceae bacterium]
MQAGTSLSVQTLLDSGQASYDAAEYDRASSWFTKAEHAALATSDTVRRARALLSLALVARKQGRLSDARSQAERSAALQERAHRVADLSRSWNALGLIAHTAGNVTEAQTYFLRAVAVASAQHDSTGMARALANLGGLVYPDLGDVEKARDALEAFRQTAVATGNRGWEATALNNMGRVAIQAGDAVSALTLLTKALAIYRELGNVEGEENALGQLGTAYRAKGEIQRALAYLADSAIAIAHSHGLVQQELDDLGQIAELYEDAGDHARALEYLARADSVNRSVGMNAEAADVARAQARVYAAQGDLELARLRAAFAEERHLTAGATGEAMADALLVAEVSARLGQRAEARDALKRARRTAERLGNAPARAELLMGEARVSDAIHEPDSVLAIVRGARKELARVNEGHLWEVDALEARAHAQLGNWPAAVESGQNAMRRVERMRGAIGAGALRASFASAKARIYGDLVIALLHLGRVSEAFRIADAAHGRALVEHIAAAGHDLRSRSGRDAVRADQLLRQIDQLLERLRSADTTRPTERGPSAVADDASLQRRLAAARSEYEQLVQRLAATDPRSSSLLGLRSSTIDAVRQSLRPDEGLIEFLVTDEGLVCFLVTSTESRSFRTPISSADLVSRVRIARDLVANRNTTPAAWHAPLAGLYDVLIAPLASAGALASLKRLVIVPHEALAYLPFAALVDNSRDEFLGEHYQLQEAPSAAALVALRATPSPRTSVPAAALAPLPRELPGSETEARAVIATVAGGELLVGADASEGATRNALSRSRVVHIATHGTLNATSPMFSRVDLARGKDATLEADNGRLEVHELLDLPVRSTLVFLSGCETGAGPAWSNAYRRGDDYLTLGQAFLFAGAQNVVATLWKIEDAGAAAFATEFYRALRAASPAEALARAQRAMLRSSRYRTPYYWAGYTLTGSGAIAAAQGHSVATVK